MIFLYALILAISYYGLFYCLILKSNNIKINKMVDKKRLSSKRYHYYDIGLSELLTFIGRWINLVFPFFVVFTLLFYGNHMLTLILVPISTLVLMMFLLPLYNLSFRLIRLNENFKRIERFKMLRSLIFISGIIMLVIAYFSIDIFSKLNHHHIDDQNFKIFYICALVVPWFIATTFQIMMMIVNSWVFKTELKNHRLSDKMKTLWNINLTSSSMNIMTQICGLFLFIPFVFASIKNPHQFPWLFSIFAAIPIIVFYNVILYGAKTEHKEKEAANIKKYLECNKKEAETNEY